MCCTLNETEDVRDLDVSLVEWGYRSGFCILLHMKRHGLEIMN